MDIVNSKQGRSSGQILVGQQKKKLKRDLFFSNATQSNFYALIYTQILFQVFWKFFDWTIFYPLIIK